MTLHSRNLAARALPQLNGTLFITDGGLETSLIFHDGIDLPLFAAFPLLKDANGRDAMKRYYQDYLDVAAEHGTGFVLESPTWRASRDWGAQLGLSADDIVSANREAIALMEELRSEHTDDGPVVISGCIGPRGDGYRPDAMMSAAEAEIYHRHQVNAFAATAADMVCALTMTHTGEAIGVVRAAQRVGLPVAIAFTVETDGCLPSGQPLEDAITETDAATGSGPAYYMINCAHPEHFESVLKRGAGCFGRVRGVRANASRCSHAELDEAEELDDGNPAELGRDYLRLRRLLPNLNLLGGCCGTDIRHVREMTQAWAAQA